MQITKTIFPANTRAILFIGLLFIVAACKTRSQEERLARQYCGSCHVFPEPGLLDKRTWDNNVLPEMAFKMGFMNLNILSKIPRQDLPSILHTIPSEPMLSEREFQLIRNYYLKNAPDSLQIPQRIVTPSLNQFIVSIPKSFRKPFTTLLKFDPVKKKLYVGNRNSELYALNNKLNVTDSIKLSGPPSHAVIGNDRLIVSSMGIMDPNDQTKGQLFDLKNDFAAKSLILDSLQRPVYFEKKDLNDDGNEDYVVCAFGNLTGALLLFAGSDNGSYKKHILNQLPGARKIAILDFNNDGSKDIVALLTQGDEQLVLFENKGDLTFDKKILVRFPPVYGSSYFELNDFNKDGHLDILYTNGDNGDYTDILKPYHAVRIFENNGDNAFKEIWSFNMPGASQATANDFDKDGDLDIAVISYFPDFKNNPEQTFMYFENTGNGNYNAHSTPLAASGRWLVMETGDFDNDTDIDIILGATNFSGFGASEKAYMRWMETNASLLLFKNTLIK
jgi:hypothetical protein